VALSGSGPEKDEFTDRILSPLCGFLVIAAKRAKILLSVRKELFINDLILCFDSWIFNVSGLGVP
jgi:hypothetical protein